MRKPRVRVRNAGGGRELIVDGTFASFYRPGSAVTGSVWDALAAPLLALPAARRGAVLILGLGGGSAARIVRAVAPEARIVGIELDAAVLAAARAHFDLDELGVDVIEADALQFLRRDRCRYDVILEDVFVGAGDAVHKPGWLPHPGLDLAAERIAPGGVLVSNTLDETRAVATALKRRFARVLRVEVDGYDNRILAAGDRLCTAADLRAAVRNDPVLGDSLGALSFRTLKP